ncbi:MAG: heme lyase CcmF/NrfE family subunit [Gammaproteobacteria bacterium]|nr:heme lyase CcmF/NrfE family subunit [Gammaproteobacteria bacterium]NNL00253.1 heme lyase CcmF/NrfE family subunit [Xanthomonadales bacterium]
MTVELGQISLAAALLTALTLGIFPMIGSYTGNRRLMAIAPAAALVQCLLLMIAFAILTAAFVVQDFSVEYVARNSNSLLPMHYRYSAVWSAHEGSLLLWELILALWIAAVALFSKRLPVVFKTRVLGVLGWVSTGFLLFIILTSNPFGRLIPSAVEGLDLNPLLQDFGLIIHPPMLYMGYVGFSVAFAFAVAALLGGELSRDWVRWSRPWTLVAWAFLTVGIALGSWWAYYELGWGGWWFWDPVENASFMPWLVGTALIHSQAVTEKRGAFGNWTLLLAISAFSLSLLGTFLVRSGVLTSVHAFASDPTRGVFILAYLAVVVGGSLTLYAVRAPKMIQGGGFAGLSRETLLLVNNLVFTIMAAMVLIGTLYPLLIDALGAGKISVGPPYFGFLFAWLLVPLVIALPIGIYSRWQEDKGNRLFNMLRWPLLIALVVGAGAWIIAPAMGLVAAIGVAGGAWVIAASLFYVGKMIQKKKQLRIPASVLAMTLAHVGLGLFLIGASLTGTISEEKHLRMEAGDRYEMSSYTFEFLGTRVVQGPNYVADEGEFVLTKNNREVTRLYPQKRQYSQGGNTMTEAAIDPGLMRDLYVSLGEPLDNMKMAWAVRVYHKPFIRWVWLGSLFMAAGGLLAAGNKRYRRKVRDSKTVTAEAKGATA